MSPSFSLSSYRPIVLAHAGPFFFPQISLFVDGILWIATKSASASSNFTPNVTSE